VPSTKNALSPSDVALPTSDALHHGPVVRSGSKGQEMLTLPAAAKRTPGRPHASTLFRWATRGHRGVRLQVWRYGRRMYTNLAAIDDFAARVATTTPEAASPPSAPSDRPPE
jgi:hypothetical protein